MAATVKVIANLENFQHRFKNIRNILPGLIKAGEATTAGMIENWIKGKGGNDRRMQPLTPRYKRRKIESGRKGIPDLNVSGDLYRSFITRRQGRYVVKLTFTRDAMGKALGNWSGIRGRSKKRRNPRLDMMSVSRKLARKATEIVSNFLKRR
jgi:hypothetical protein